MPENTYKAEPVEGYENIAVINTGKQVLGGTDALNFTNQLQQLIKSGVECVIIDMGDVEIINSSGIGMLVNGLTTLKNNDIKMILANTPGKVLKLLKMTHLDKVFILYDTVEEAAKFCTQ